MSKNKGIREFMVHKYGKICFMEAAGIRNIPKEERKKIKGYKRIQEKLTFHHIRPISEGGKATEENGAILKKYNHEWLEQQPKAERDKINKQLQEYKIAVLEMKNGKIRGKVMQIDMSDTYEIPVIDKEKEVEEER